MVGLGLVGIEIVGRLRRGRTEKDEELATGNGRALGSKKRIIGNHSINERSGF